MMPTSVLLLPSDYEVLREEDSVSIKFNGLADIKFEAAGWPRQAAVLLDMRPDGTILVTAMFDTN